MGKTKKKVKKEKSFNEYIRLLMTVQEQFSSMMLLKDMSIETIGNLLNDFKEMYSRNSEIGSVSSYVDYLTFSKMIDAVYDILYVYSLNKNKDFGKILKNINTRLIEDLKNSGENGLEVFVAINKLCFLFDREMLLKRSYNQTLIENLSGVVFSNAIYIQTYLTKFENKHIRAFEFKKGSSVLKIKYTDNKLVDDNILINSRKSCLNGEFDNSVKVFLKQFMEDVHQSYEEFLSGEARTLNRYYYYLDESFESNPLYNERGLISLNEIMKIPNDRKYLYSSGVRFAFLKNTSNIKHIDIIEKQDEFIFHVKIKNNENVRKLGVQGAKENDLYHGQFNKYDYPVSKEEYVIAILGIKKKSLSAKWSEDNLVLLAESMGAGKIMGSPTVFYATNYLILSCLYMALYNPFLFKNFINTSSIRREGSSFVKEDSFRVAHIRKLQKGATASIQAKANAKEFGFNIPNGYTFVSAHYSKEDVLKEGYKKEIKINL